MGTLTTQSDSAALFNIVDGQCFREHPNGGGLVALTARVAPHVYVGPDARVEDSAVIDGEYQLVDRARVGGSAQLRGRGRLTQDSRVNGRAILLGFVKMMRSSVVTDEAKLDGTISLDYAARVEGVAVLVGRLMITGW